MYDLPAMDNVTKVVMDEAVIQGDAKPYMVYESGDNKKSASSND